MDSTSEPQIVYIDDSGTDPKSRIAAAAFCVSTADRWLEFADKWDKIADYAGFELKNWHMAEFAACRFGNLCQQCRHGQTSAVEHRWQKWTEKKRENVLNRLAKALAKHTECSYGIAHTKEDYDEHVRNSPARALAGEPIGDEHFTFAVQQCGGKLAEWRAANGRRNPVKFVFDLATKRERGEIAKVFFAAANDRSKYQGGIEQWFEPGPKDVVFESRKSTVQLLAADMVAWNIATIRAREIFRKGRFVEAHQLAKIFVGTEHIKIGYTNKQTLAKWEADILDKSTAVGQGQ